jgi:hypothetical protein
MVTDVNQASFEGVSNLTPPRQDCTQAEFTDDLFALSACLDRINLYSSSLLLPSLFSLFEMSAPSVPSKPQHSRHDTALIHGLSTSEVQALSEACIEAKERAYCKSLYNHFFDMIYTKTC